MNFLDRFVAARFWLAPGFITLYYAQLGCSSPTLTRSARALHF